MGMTSCSSASKTLCSPPHQHHHSRSIGICIEARLPGRGGDSRPAVPVEILTGPYGNQGIGVCQSGENTDSIGFPDQYCCSSFVMPCGGGAKGGAATHSFEFSNCARTAMMGSWLLMSIFLCTREGCRGEDVYCLGVEREKVERREEKVGRRGGGFVACCGTGVAKKDGKLFFMI